MMDQTCLRPAHGESLLESRQGQGTVQSIAGRPADDAAGEQVEDDRQIQPAFRGPYVRDVDAPLLIGKPLPQKPDRAGWEPPAKRGAHVANADGEVIGTFVTEAQAFMELVRLRKKHGLADPPYPWTAPNPITGRPIVPPDFNAMLEEQVEKQARRDRLNDRDAA
jgi:hypothetical protein